MHQFVGVQYVDVFVFACGIRLARCMHSCAVTLPPLSSHDNTSEWTWAGYGLSPVNALHLSHTAPIWILHVHIGQSEDTSWNPGTSEHQQIKLVCHYFHSIMKWPYISGHVINRVDCLISPYDSFHLRVFADKLPSHPNWTVYAWLQGHIDFLKSQWYLTFTTKTCVCTCQGKKYAHYFPHI